MQHVIFRELISISLQKIVVVDNRVALVGGLDLCFGRFDTHAHRHADYPAKGHQYQMFPGQDYSSPRVKDFANGTRPLNIEKVVD